MGDNSSLKYAYMDSAGGHVMTVATGNFGQFASLALRGAAPRIAYYDAASNNIKYATYSRNMGWKHDTVSWRSCWTAWCWTR